MASNPRKRTRDYSAERARRNAEARRWGFTSLDQMSKARRRGEFPTAAVLRKDPGAGMRAVFAREDREMQAFVRERTPAGRQSAGRSRSNAGLHDRESQQWSDAHSQQKSTRFNKRWSASKKEQYYQTFVTPWGDKRSLEEMMAYHDWQIENNPDYDGRDNPYVQ